MEQNKALLERIRLFVLDLDGTIYLGDRLLPGAAEFITTAKEKGRQVLFFTNNTSRSPMEYVERLSRMGIPVTREDILTAGDVTIHYLQTHCAGQSVYLLGVPALRQSFAEAGISLTEEQPDLVVVGFDKTLTYERLEKACIYLRRGAHFLATHPDINCPTEAEPIPDCGAICQAITTSTGFMPHSLGKPAAETVELVEAVSGLPREAIAFVGDRLYTDVACGTQNGACGILVMTGETTPEMLAESSFSPDEPISFSEAEELLHRTFDPSWKKSAFSSFFTALGQSSERVFAPVIDQTPLTRADCAVLISEMTNNFPS